MAKSAVSIISFILNIVYVAAGVLLVLASVLYYTEMQEIKSVRNKVLHVISSGMSWAEMVPYIFISVGLLVVLVSLCGFGGAYSKPVLIVYITFLSIAVIASTTATVVVSKNADNDSSEKFIGDIIQEGVGISSSAIISGVTTAFGTLESKYSCCGSNEPDDYINMTTDRLYPKSCCGGDKPCSEITHGVFVKNMIGCKKVVAKKTRSFIKYLWWGSTCVSVIGFINLVVAILGLTLIVVKDRNTNERRNVQETQLRINGTVNSVTV